MRRSSIILPLAALATYAACSDGGVSNPLSPVQPEGMQPLRTVTETVLSGTNIAHCSQLPGAESDWYEIKVEPAQSGTYSGPDGSSVTVTISDKTASWTFTGVTSNGVDVFVNKAGPNSYVYTYSPEATSGSSTTPYGPSHLLFCYDPDPDARIRLEPSYDTNEVNDVHTFTAYVELDVNRDGTFETNAPDGTVVTFSLSGPGTLFEHGTTTAATQCTTTSGSCQIDLKSGVAGTSVVNAYTTFTYNGDSFTRDTDPATADVAGPGGSGPATKVWVDAYIALSPLTDTNGITEQHEISATVKQDDGIAAADGGDGGDGWANAPDGTTVTFSLLNNTAGAYFVDGTNTCTTVSGSCSVFINSNSAGGVDIHGTTTFSVGGVSLTRATGTGGNNSADAHKDYVDGSIAFLKHDDQSQLLGGATFEVCRTHDYNSGTGLFVDVTDVCVSVLDNNSPDADATAGEFLLEDLILGRYTVQETAAPSGYLLDPDVVTVEITVASPNASIAEAFVNPPALLEGCTPGFWKNHTYLWDQNSDQIASAIFAATGYYGTTSARFKDVFGIGNMRGLSNNLTLGEAINLGGGDFNKLARHGTAALLNAASDQTSYPLSISQVVSQVRDAFANNTPEPLATQLDEYNNLGCDAQ